MGFSPLKQRRGPVEENSETASGTQTKEMDETSSADTADRDSPAPPTLTLTLETDAWAGYTWVLHPMLSELLATWGHHIDAVRFTPSKASPITVDHCQLQAWEQTLLDDSATRFAETMAPPTVPNTTTVSMRALQAIRKTPGSAFDFFYRLQEALYRDSTSIECTDLLADIAEACGVARDVFAEAYTATDINQLPTLETVPRLTISYGDRSVTLTGLITASDLRTRFLDWGIEPASEPQPPDQHLYGPTVAARIAERAGHTTVADHADGGR